MSPQNDPSSQCAPSSRSNLLRQAPPLNFGLGADSPPRPRTPPPRPTLLNGKKQKHQPKQVDKVACRSRPLFARRFSKDFFFCLETPFQTPLPHCHPLKVALRQGSRKRKIWGKECLEQRGGEGKRTRNK